jgi:hypothetical protein
MHLYDTVIRFDVPLPSTRKFCDSKALCLFENVILYFTVFAMSYVSVILSIINSLLFISLYMIKSVNAI